MITFKLKNKFEKGQKLFSGNYYFFNSIVPASVHAFKTFWRDVITNFSFNVNKI